MSQMSRKSLLVRAFTSSAPRATAGFSLRRSFWMRPSESVSTRSAISPTGALWVITAVAVPSSRFTCADHLEHAHAGAEVERAGGLVAQQDVRPLGDGARDGHALLLAAGELRRKVVEPLAQADQLQRFVGLIGSSAMSVTSATFSRAVRLGIRL